ncbi:serine-rich adhesin for platelets-like [Gossypium australe]|uniref:Serine-rich adhesin for platelets-like n=1 Tax=Gossypium australe TaxID=47621 RepID=A0A5B6UJ21_9ROSI|nr:serine-rich adhesin for platelets-like [Gossypium australe]
MNGTKRFALSSSATDANDSAFLNKRIMAGSPFDPQRAEPSQQQPNATPPLDPQRAELSRRHVKALNIQFARFYLLPITTFYVSSWVQSQLKNHPDELWQDGVSDYLSHASNIMDKFSDVVNWLKANAANGDSLSAAESHKNESKMVPETKNTENKFFQGKIGFTPTSTTTSLIPGSTTLSFSPGTTAMSFSPGTTAGMFSLNTTTTRSTPADMTKKFPPLGTTTSFTLASSTTSFTPVGLTTGSMAAGSNSSFSFGLSTANFTSSSTTNSFTSSNMTSSFASPWSTGAFSNSQSPFLFGTQSSVSVDNNAADDAGDGGTIKLNLLCHVGLSENELPQPSSPSVKKSEEKGIVVVHEVKCKLYVKSTDPADKDSWKDKGTGQLSIKCKEGISKGSKDSKPTIVVRNEVGKVLLNALLYPGIKTSAQKNSLVAIFHTSDEGGDNQEVVARTFLIRTKTEDDRNKLVTAIQEYAPAS